MVSFPFLICWSMYNLQYTMQKFYICIINKIVLMMINEPTVNLSLINCFIWFCFINNGILNDCWLLRCFRLCLGINSADLCDSATLTCHKHQASGPVPYFTVLMWKICSTLINGLRNECYNISKEGRINRKITNVQN